MNLPRLMLAMCLGIGWLGVGQASDRDRALDILDQAIRAHGGSERLPRARTLIRKATGVMTLFGKDISFTTTLTLAFPDRFRDQIEVDADGMKKQLTRALNRTAGWQSSGEFSTEMNKDEMEDLREEAYFLWLTTLVPLKDEAFILAPLPETKPHDKPAVGIKVSRAGHADARLYFDKQSNLLIKMERRGRVAGLGVNKEYQFSDYREFQGITLPTKHVEFHDGKKALELTITAYDFPGRLDDKLFEKP